MVNHPNRSGASYRFIAFSTLHQGVLGRGTTAAEALAEADRLTGGDRGFTEILDCGENGRKVWTGGVIPGNPVPLYKAREKHRTVFRGDGYADSYNPLPAIPLAAE